MPAPKRISDEAVMEAIQLWRGKVEAAADRLGIAPNNLRKRLDALRVDLSLLRDGERYRMSNTQPNVSNPSTRTNRQKSAAPIYPGSGPRPIVPGMQSAAPSLPTIPAKVKPTRLRPDHQERFREAKFDLQARFRMETDENRILEQFIDDCLDGWLRKKLAEKAEPAK